MVTSDVLSRLLHCRALHRVGFMVCLLAILYLALMPAPDVESLLWDKLNHMLAFFTLAVLLRMGWPRMPIRWVLLTLLVLGGFIEVAQFFVGRDAAWGDLLADAIGLLLAIAATSIFRMRPAATASE